MIMIRARNFNAECQVHSKIATIVSGFLNGHNNSGHFTQVRAEAEAALRNGNHVLTILSWTSWNGNHVLTILSLTFWTQAI